MITLNFDEVLKRVYNAKKGVEVRYGLGQGFEYCKQFTEEAGTRADAAKEAAQTAATNAKASEKKATDAVAGIEQTKTDAVQAVQNAQNTATTAVTTKQTEAVQAVGTAKTGAVKAVDDERDAALQQVADSTKAAQTAASNAAAAEQAAQASKEAAATSAGDAANSATAASGSASAAATSESNANQSAENSEASAARSEAAAELAGTRANTDKTLKTENAPADAKATGEAIAKCKADTLLAAYPVGSLYMSVDATSPASLFGGTWEQISKNRVLMGAGDGHSGGDTAEAGLPNITGMFEIRPFVNNKNPDGTIGIIWDNEESSSGAFSCELRTSNNDESMSVSFTPADKSLKSDVVSFDASKSNSIYGSANTVQPSSYYAYIWRRIA